jgi:hypothetical protein
MADYKTSTLFPVPCLEDANLHRSDPPTDCDVELTVSSAGGTWVVPLLSSHGERKFVLGYKPFAPKEVERMRTKLI